MNIEHTLLTRGLALVALAALAMPAQAADRIDPDTPEGYVQVQRKIQCSTKDEHPVVYTWSGRAYSRVPGERDKHLFNLDGMNIRQCGTVNDPQKGRGFRLVTREILLYQHPETGETLAVWK